MAKPLPPGSQWNWSEILHVVGVMECLASSEIFCVDVICAKQRIKVGMAQVTRDRGFGDGSHTSVLMPFRVSQLYVRVGFLDYRKCGAYWAVFLLHMDVTLGMRKQHDTRGGIVGVNDVSAVRPFHI